MCHYFAPDGMGRQKAIFSELAQEHKRDDSDREEESGAGSNGVHPKTQLNNSFSNRALPSSPE